MGGKREMSASHVDLPGQTVNKMGHKAGINLNYLAHFLPAS